MLPLMLSPYDLSSHAASVVVGAMLGERLVTMLPSPVEGDDLDALRRAGDSSPMFLRLAESWRWTGPLWRAGLIQPGLNGARAADEMARAAARIAGDPALAPLRSVVERDSDVDPSDRFNALCRDLLLGGSNPVVSVPLTAAVEAFSATHGLTLIRITPTSLAGRLERHGARPTLRLSMAMIVEADADDLLLIRGAMSETLGVLRASVSKLVSMMREGESERELSAWAAARLEPQRADYERVLLERVDALRSSDRASGRRIKIARVSLTGSMVEAGSSLVAAATAAAALANARAIGAGGGSSGSGVTAREAPAVTGVALANRSLAVLTVKPMRLDL